MRTTAVTFLLLIVMLFLASACDKAPSGIIKESKMVGLLADLYKAEAYTDVYRADFANDSLRMELKQSVFAKHGVTQADYDRSLEWYAHNMDTYANVCQRAMARLDEEKKKSYRHQEDHQPRAAQPGGDRTTSPADDIWHGRRAWTLTPSMKNGFITFEIDAAQDVDTRQGDRYELTFKAATPAPKAIGVFFAADYADGATAFLSRQSLANGWNRIVLQTDSARRVKRIYGYFAYRLPPTQAAYLDSIQILRSKLNRQQYSRTGVQRLVERNTAHAAHEKKDDAPRDLRNDAFGRKPTFKPVEGLNKSSTPAHINSSPNAQHLPSAR